jgi:hypothetical protein
MLLISNINYKNTFMNTNKKLSVILPLSLSFLLIASPASAAAPDGFGPAADTVFSFSQGLTKDGLAVPAIRSDPATALGVAENDTIDGNFVALGFGGNIVLGFDNGISTGTIIIESTELFYPGEKANVEMSEDGVTWVMAGSVVQDGTVNKPSSLACARYVRLTDTSNPADFPDLDADGYDVDGVVATGDPCLPTPTPTAGPTATPTPTQTTSSNPGGSSSTSSTSTSTSNTSSSSCTAVTATPNIISTRRLSPTSIFVNWGPDNGFSDFIVQYGFQNGNWQFSTKVSGFSTNINDLPANQPIWIQVAATNNCSIGAYGSSVFTGGSTTVPGFPNTGCVSTGNPLVPCFPNTGNPGLPNTGIEPNGNNIFSNIQTGIQYIYSLFLRILN